MRHESREDYEPIVQRNLFVRGRRGAAPRSPRCGPGSQPEEGPGPRPEPAPVKAPGPDPAKDIYHVGTVVQDDRREAWLYDRVHKRDFVLVEGTPFEVAGLSGIVQAVGQDFVLLEIDGHARRLEFSQNLRQLKATP